MRVTVPVVLGSANARVGLPAAIAALRSGCSAMDAAVAAVKCVEDNRDDHGVGTGGIPNVLGQVELDASVMDGRTLAAGAIWRERVMGGAPTGSSLYADSYQMYMAAVRDWVELLPDRILGTTNVIVRDTAGDIAS